MKGIAIVALGFAAIVTVRMVPVLNLGYAQANTHDESCTLENGLIGAEDITIDHERGIALIASDDRRTFLRTGEMSDQNGALWTLDLSRPDSDIQKISIDLTGPFHPHGISLYIDNDGTRFLFVINHITTEQHAVNIFRLQGDDKATLERTVVVPEFSSPNDLHAVGPNQFFFTNDHYFSRDTIGEKIEDFLRLPTSNVVYYDGKEAYEVINGLFMANGIIATPDLNNLYVAESSGKQIARFERDQTGSWKRVSNIELDVMPDNLEFDQQGQLLVASHPKALDFLLHTFDENVAAPSIAQRININSKDEIETLYYDSGEILSGSSVAATHNNQLLVGTVFERQIARCEI